MRIFKELTDVYKEVLWKSPAVLNYLIQNRALTEDIIRKAEIGFCRGTVGMERLADLGLTVEAQELKLINKTDYFDGFITFPVYKEDEIFTIYGRRFSGEGRNNHCFPKGISNSYPYGTQLLGTQESVIIVEAPIDALTLSQRGFSAISVMGCNLNESLIPYFTNKSVYIMFDNDNPGEQGAIKASRKLMGVAKYVYMATIPGKPGAKKIDVNDYFIKNVYAEDRIKALLKNLRPIKRPPIPKRSGRTKKIKEDDVDIKRVARVLFGDRKYDLYESGSSIWVQCPHHSQGVERNRSLWIGGGKNMFNCFGCQTGGGPVRLVNWHLNISFLQARKWIRENLSTS